MGMDDQTRSVVVGGGDYIGLKITTESAGSGTVSVTATAGQFSIRDLIDHLNKVSLRPGIGGEMFNLLWDAADALGYQQAKIEELERKLKPWWKLW